MCSGYDIEVWLGKVFSPCHTADVLCTEVHKRRETMRGGECVDARGKSTTSKKIMLFICGCQESELRLSVIRGVFILPNLLKNVS